MAERWTLNRAGIVNVYQYDDETLDFAGGRLLLRGVNGSGKSTAMNMLLPFLLDANVRRIDAAGEQAGVLRSWMLSGRDEVQPVGYLWIEFARGADHLVCGCGIRANRNTDRVTTWWFVTDRRPGIDLALVERRVPLSADALKATIGAHAVFTQDQRPAYRREIQSRLFGGAELEQHIRLLHIVRNPRVGDRIDEDLPAYLDEALPQLSDTAIEDAAQPLEDLEEHRRNVDALQRTSTALTSLGAVYGDYARTELTRRADDALELVRRARSRGRDASARRREADDARQRRAEAKATVERLVADETRLREEISSLEAAPAYQDGRALDDLRRNVRDLAEAVARANRRAEETVTALQKAADATREAHRRSEQDRGVLTRSLGDLALHVDGAGLAVALPEVPVLPATVEADVPLPASEPKPVVDGPAWRQRVAPVGASVATRQREVDDVRRALTAADQAHAELVRREADASRAQDQVTAAETDADKARTELERATAAWRADLQEWIAALLDRWRLTTPAPPSLDGVGMTGISDLAVRYDEIRAELGDAALQLAAHHQRELAQLDARLLAEQAQHDRLAAQLDELNARTEPEPPALPWLRSGDHPRLSELIDFADALDDGAQAGLEGALEASGLLAARVHGDGRVELETGDLVVLGDDPAPSPLSDLLVVTIGEHHADVIDAASVRAVLGAISTDVADTHPTAVSTDGTFRIGALRGRHVKAEAEHIGATARRAALERLRHAVAAQLAEARATVETTTAARDRSEQLHSDALAHRAALPSGTEVANALRARDLADERLVASRNHLDQAVAARGEADDVHSRALTEAQRIGATLGVTAERAALDDVERSLRDVTVTARQVEQDGTLVERAFAEWVRAADAWRAARSRAEAATADLAERIAEHEPLAMRLATLEDTIGAAYAEVVAALDVSRRDLKQTTSELGPARDHAEVAATELTRAEATLDEATRDHQAAERQAIAELPALRRVLAVPGLAAAALTDWTITVAPTTHDVDDAAIEPEDGIAAGTATVNDECGFRLPPVDESVDGVRQLAEVMLAQLAELTDGRGPTTGESVRQSLRQRRDALGAGWDAEDHQVDDDLPLSVEVNGPLGRMHLAAAGSVVAHSLAKQASLLTTQQDQALRNLLQGLVAKEVAEKLHVAGDLVALMNRRLDTVSTTHGIGARLRWKRRDDLDTALTTIIDLLAKPADLRTADEDKALVAALSERIADARRAEPDAIYRDLIAQVLDYRRWHEMAVLIRRPGQPDQRLNRRTPLSEGEKKMVSYLPLFAAVAASADALAAHTPDAPRFVLLDDAFAKVSEDNHAGLWGLLVELDLDVIATSERLWGTHDTVPELAITEVVRDAELGVIVLEHARWDGSTVHRHDRS